MNIYEEVPTYDEMLAAVNAGRISVSYFNDYALFKYRRETQYARDWDNVTLHARGIIYDCLTGECVALPFKKFFNLGETDDDLSKMPTDLASAEVLEKLDGSMGCIFQMRCGELLVATPGSMQSPQAQWATKWLRAHEKYDKLKCGMTLQPDGSQFKCVTTEILYPGSAVVVDYDYKNQSGLHLTSVQFTSGQLTTYLPYQMLAMLGESLGWPVCKLYDFPDVDKLHTFLNTQENFEGFVLHWPDTGFRLKIKAEEYVRLHRILSSVHPNRIDEAIEASEGATFADIIDDLQEVLVQFPEEVCGPYADAVNELAELADNIVAHVAVTLVQAKHEFGEVQTHKTEFAKKLMGGGYGEFNKRYSWTLFGTIAGKNIQTPKNMLRLWCNDIRPKYDFEETKFIAE